MQIYGTHGHDTSVVQIIDEKVSYVKLERLYQIKHFGVQDNNHNIIYKYIKNMSYKDFWKRFSPYREDTETDLAFKGPTHHLGHALSVELFEPCDVHVVIDGSDGADDPQWWSVWRDGVKIASGKLNDTYGSIGAIAIIRKGIKGHGLDIAGKLMGIQSYGKFNETYYKELEKWTCDRLGDPLNSMWVGLQPKRWDLEQRRKLVQATKHIPHLFKEPPNLEGQDRLDWIHTVHFRAGEIVMSIFDRWVSPDETIGYSGGVAQNVVWNTLLKQRYPKLRIYPHCGDEGIALGRMYYYNKKRNVLPAYPFCQDDESPSSEPSLDTINKVARYLSEGRIVAWYQGHGEVGPRALGNRSILMDPRIPDGKDRINKVKKREPYRPFGSSVLSEWAESYFGLTYPNPYMLYLGHTRRNDLHAITHVDGTSRAQTVEPSNNSFRVLLEHFYELTGCPVLLNTSLNEAGKPIAGWIRNAENLFKESSGIDVLVIGDQIHTR